MAHTINDKGDVNEKLDTQLMVEGRRMQLLQVSGSKLSL